MVNLENATWYFERMRLALFAYIKTHSELERAIYRRLKENPNLPREIRNQLLVILPQYIDNLTLEPNEPE